MGRRIFMLAVLGGGLAGCDTRDLPVQEDDLLVLELGGTHKLLRAVLHLREPKQSVVNTPVARQRAERMRDAVPSSFKVAARTSVPQRAVPEPSRYFEVALEPGQTLYQLCRLHLANPGRWREVMKLNGLQEAELRRLPAGMKIRLPRREE